MNDSRPRPRFLTAPNVAGVAVGVAGLVLSFAGRGLVPGRLLGDPLPLVLSVTTLLRSFIYFNWRAPLLHLLFAVALGAAATLALQRVLGRDITPHRDDALRAAQIAAGLNVVVAALTELDAVIVLIWYALAGFLSVTLSGIAATFLAGRLGFERGYADD